MRLDKVTIIDMDETTISGINKYGIKAYFGDASRPELLLKAGIEDAKVLVVAIDNPELTLRIVEFAREVNPNIKLVVRSYDRVHTFRLYGKGVNDIIRETFDSAVRSGKRTLEYLGMPKETAEKVGELYFRMDRNGMGKMASLYDPELSLFANEAMLEEGKLQDQKIAEMIQILLEEEKIK